MRHIMVSAVCFHYGSAIHSRRLSVRSPTVAYQQYPLSFLLNRARKFPPLQCFQNSPMHRQVLMIPPRDLTHSSAIPRIRYIPKLDASSAFPCYIRYWPRQINLRFVFLKVVFHGHPAHLKATGTLLHGVRGHATTFDIVLSVSLPLSILTILPAEVVGGQVYSGVFHLFGNDLPLVDVSHSKYKYILRWT